MQHETRITGVAVCYRDAGGDFMAQNDQPTGRYQVASGVSQTVRKGGEPDTISVVLLVDTVTGQTRALYAPEGANIRWTGILQTDGKP